MKSSRITLSDALRTQAEFKSKLCNMRIGGKNQIYKKMKQKNIMNLYDAREEVIKFYKD